ncbi:alpha/beta hydrolase [Paenibacillus sp. N1-5-1-14]|uniref:alpha/beta fold hydrolase n=1 Tax=Paenibacillus radicibacter TaxID=2972488 RepID=UPI0021591B92|nr:alpha/beta hydrolase [Paenibacillus radicibacter]MCR8641258.1 alpha/beta hydrolase [Paenibacillus radicibacter]
MPYCELPNINIHYEIHGQGKPIVILHGYNGDMTLVKGGLEPIFEHINEEWQRIYIDLPGMGRSDRPAWIHHSDDMLAVVEQVIEKLLPNETFLVAGYSYGGYLARALLKRMHARIQGMLLLCPLIIADRTDRELPEKTVVYKNEAFLDQVERSETFAAFQTFATVYDEYHWQRYQQEVLPGKQRADAEFLARIQQNGYGLSFDVDQVEVPYDQPVLLLLGRQDQLVGFKDACKLMDHYSRGTFAVVDRASHNLAIEQSEMLHLMVTEWLNRVREYISTAK